MRTLVVGPNYPTVEAALAEMDGMPMTPVVCLRTDDMGKVFRAGQVHRSQVLVFAHTVSPNWIPFFKNAAKMVIYGKEDGSLQKVCVFVMIALKSGYTPLRFTTTMDGDGHDFMYVSGAKIVNPAWWEARMQIANRKGEYFQKSLLQKGYVLPD